MIIGVLVLRMKRLCLKEVSRQPGLEGFVAVIPQLLLFGFIFGSFMRFADARPRTEIPSLILQGRGVGGSIELGECAKFNGP